MQTVSFDLPDTVVQMIDQVCLENGVMKNALFKELLVRYLEDLEDGIAAKLVLDEYKDNRSWKTMDELSEELHLDR